MTEEQFLADLTGDTGDEDQEEEDEEEEDFSESDEEEIEVPRKSEASTNGGPRRKVLESTVGKVPNVGTMLRTLQQEGLSGPLLWLQNCLNRTADDREEDELSQPVPLVPLTEENEDAMEMRSFQKLLRKLGLRAPANEQESFWRIPEKLSPSQLRGAAAALTPREELPVGGEEPLESGSPNQEHEEDVSSHEQRSEALRALLLARKRKPHSGRDTNDPAPIKDVPIGAVVTESPLGR